MKKIIIIFIGVTVLLYFLIGSILVRNEIIQRLYILPGWSIKYGSDDDSKFSVEPPIVFQSARKMTQILNKNNSLTVVMDSLQTKDSIISINDDNGKSLFSVKLKEAIRKSPYEYNHPSKKIFVVSDIEGNFSFFEKLLKSNKVIDNDFNWIYGSNHLVLLGDYFDRGTKVFESLWLIYKLEEQAEKQGGKVHFILGNHDIMNLEGDYRYVRKKYFKNADSLDLEYKNWISNDSELGKWLRSKNVLEKINNNLFVHAGISPNIIKNNQTLESINIIISQNIGIKPITEQLKLLKNQESPYWYRGYFTSQDGYKQTTQKEIDGICNYFKVNKLIVGHTPVDEIKTYYKGKVLGIDVLRENEIGENPPSALLIEKNQYFSVDELGNIKEIKVK